MTREEFMSHARAEVGKAFEGTRNRIMNLVEQAWAEGKRNAETEQITSIIGEALDRLNEKPKTGRWEKFMIDSRGYSDVFRCTSCGQITHMYMYMKDCDYDYCPNCGARMEADKNDL